MVMSHLEAALDALLSGKARTRPGYGGHPPVSGAHGYTHPLETLLARGVISPSHYYGGCRFRSDYESALVSGTSTTNWERVTRKPPTGSHYHAGGDDTMARIATMLGPVDFRIVVAVCHHGFTMQEIAEATHMARKTVKDRFLPALRRVADYYTKIVEECSTDR
jgi:hypothetical protein